MKEIVPYSQQDLELFDENGHALRTVDGNRIRIRRDDILVILEPLLTQFPHSGATEETLQIYAGLLRDISPVRLLAAVEKAQRECEFLPSVAAIRRNYEDSRQKHRRQANVDIDEEMAEWIKNYPNLKWTTSRAGNDDQLNRVRRSRRDGDAV